MTWLLLAFLSALSDSLRDVTSKIILKQEFNAFFIAWIYRFSALPWLLPLAWFSTFPEFSWTFFGLLMLSVALKSGMTIIYLTAIKLTDLSLLSPLSTFTLVFVTILSPILINEFPDAYGLIGIGFIFFGSYVLNIKNIKDNLFLPITSLFKNKGTVLMLIVTFIWGLSSVIDKIGLRYTTPHSWALLTYIFMSVALLPGFLIDYRKHLKQIKENAGSFAILGFFGATAILFHMFAISLMLVAYVIAIKRVRGLLGILWGYLFFNERKIGYRIVGAAIMLVGVVLITLL